MDNKSNESQAAEVAESQSALVSLGNAADMTLGEGGRGSESKRYEYN